MNHEVDGSLSKLIFLCRKIIRLVEYIVALMGVLREFQHLGVCFFSEADCVLRHN